MSTETVVAIKADNEMTLAIVQPAHLTEELTRTIESQVRESAAAARERPVVLDLGNVEFMPSVSLGALVTICMDCKQNRQRLALVGLQPTIREALTITRLDKLFEIYHDVDEARQHFRMERPM